MRIVNVVFDEVYQDYQCFIMNDSAIWGAISMLHGDGIQVVSLEAKGSNCVCK